MRYTCCQQWVSFQKQECWCLVENLISLCVVSAKWISYFSDGFSEAKGIDDFRIDAIFLIFPIDDYTLRIPLIGSCQYVQLMVIFQQSKTWFLVYISFMPSLFKRRTLAFGNALIYFKIEITRGTLPCPFKAVIT